MRTKTSTAMVPGGTRPPSDLNLSFQNGTSILRRNLIFVLSIYYCVRVLNMILKNALPYITAINLNI